jgi:hypothetical protein
MLSRFPTGKKSLSSLRTPLVRTLIGESPAIRSAFRKCDTWFGFDLKGAFLEVLEG